MLYFYCNVTITVVFIYFVLFITPLRQHSVGYVGYSSFMVYQGVYKSYKIRLGLASLPVYKLSYYGTLYHCHY